MTEAEHLSLDEKPANDNGVLKLPLPRLHWIFEVDGSTFTTLYAAEHLSRRLGKPIYCRLTTARKYITR